MLSYYCIPLARRYVLFAIFTKSNYARLYCWRANNPDIYLPAALEECRRSCHETSNYMARNQLSFVPPQPSRKYHERPLQLNPSYIAGLHCELGGSRPWPYFDEVRVFCVDTARLDFSSTFRRSRRDEFMRMLRIRKMLWSKEFSIFLWPNFTRATSNLINYFSFVRRSSERNSRVSLLNHDGGLASAYSRLLQQVVCVNKQAAWTATLRRE